MEVLLPAGALQPPEERAEFVCAGCAQLLFAGQRAHREALYGDVLGCELCCEWSASGPGEEGECPNCGQWVDDVGRWLLAHSGERLACGECGGDVWACDACERIPEGEEAARCA